MSALIQPPTVTIGMPAYNAERSIQASIDSMTNQSFTDFELVIVDNASTDRTPEICQNAAKQDSRIRFFRNEYNMGAADNYNLALKLARGELFKWCSSNDLHHPDFLRVCVHALSENPDAVLAHTKTCLFNDNPDVGELYEEHLGLSTSDPAERFLRFLERVQLNNVMNGVFRTKALRLAPPIKAVIGSDLVTTAATTLYGPFIELSHMYFYRRMDIHSATRLRGEAGIREHYAPGHEKVLLFQVWRLRFGYVVAVAKAPIQFRVKFSLIKHLIRHMIWARRELLHDAFDSLKSVFRNPTT